MRVGVVTGSVSRLAGGLFESVRFPSQLINSWGYPHEVFALKDRNTAEDLPSWSPITPRLFSTLGPRYVGFSPGLREALMKSDVDIVQSHGIFLWLSGHVNAWHRRTGKPYMVSPHGMVDPWALRNSRWKKRVARWLFEDRHLHEAACLRALCDSEAESMRQLGLRNPIAIIPNAVALPAQGKEIGDGADRLRLRELESRSSESYLSTNSDLRSAKKLLLFLGRLHPKKGLAELIEAWAKTGQRKDWTLVIAGWGDPRYVESLKGLAREKNLKEEIGVGTDRLRLRLGLREHESRSSESNPSTISDLPSSNEPAGEICFAGPVFGADKERLLANAEGFVLPSYSEGLPVAVLEAWSQAVPVLMTAECTLPEGFQSGAALEVKLKPTAEKAGLRLAEGLEKLVTMKEEERREMGLKGRRLVEERFTWPEVAGQFLETYKWILGDLKDKPGFVSG